MHFVINAGHCDFSETWLWALHSFKLPVAIECNYIIHVLFRIIIVYTLLCSAYHEYFYCHIGLSIPLHSLLYTPKFPLWLYNYATTPCCSVFVLCDNKIVAFSSDSDSCICYNDPSCTQIASLIAVSWNCNIHHIHIKLIYVYTWHQSETSWWSVVLAHMRSPKLCIMYM